MESQIQQCWGIVSVLLVLMNQVSQHDNRSALKVKMVCNSVWLLVFAVQNRKAKTTKNRSQTITTVWQAILACSTEVMLRLQGLVIFLFHAESQPLLIYDSFTHDSVGR